MKALEYYYNPCLQLLILFLIQKPSRIFFKSAVFLKRAMHVH